MSKKVQKLPKWFKGITYEKGDIVHNKFSGESYKLNNIELSMFDFIMGAVQVFEMQESLNKFDGTVLGEDFRKNLKKSLNWFKKNNPKAYMALLD